MVTPVEIALIALAFLVAGTVKGVVGLGLPTTAIGLMTLWMDPRSAIAITLLPMLTTNLWQVFRQGETIAAARRYLPFALALMIGVWITLMLSRDAPERLLLGVLGGAILLFVIVNLTRFAPVIPDRYDRLSQVIAGALAGVLGGLTSVWAPPMAIYLAARRTGKAEFVRATGVLIVLGSLPLVAGYLRLGFLSTSTAAWSLLLLVPAVGGFTLGEAMRGRLSERSFRAVLLFFFAVMGLNLLRKALF